METNIFIKILEPYESGREYVDLNAEFIREVSLLAILKSRSEHVVTIKAFDPSQLNITLEYIPVALGEYISLNPDITLLTFKHLTYQIILGLKHLQNLNILHRDIKPENIMITNDMNVKLIDFGISAYNYNHFNDWDRTRTEGYRAPECYLYWPLDEDMELLRFDKIDVWSLGTVLLNIMYKTKEGPFDSYDTDLDYLLYYAYLSTERIDDLYMTFIEGFVNRKDKDVTFLLSSLRLYAPDHVQMLSQEGFITTIKSLQYLDVFARSDHIHPLAERVRPLITQMLIFSPRSRYSTTDILLDPFFSEVRKDYEQSTYDVYKPQEEGLYPGDRDAVIDGMLDLLVFMRGKWVELLNAIYILDQYSVLKGHNKDTQDEQINALIVVCVLISTKLYRYVDIEDEYVYDRREGGLIDWPIAIYRDTLDWNEIILLEQEVIVGLHNSIYIPRSVFTDTYDNRIRGSYVSLLTHFNYIGYTDQEKMTYCRQNIEPNKYSSRILMLN